MIACGAALLLASCAQTKIKTTYVSDAPVDDPRSIYIRPFATENMTFAGDYGDTVSRDLREGQADVKFARILKQELAKLAPTMVLDDDEVAPEGWVIDGEFDVLDAGWRAGRAAAGWLGGGRSTIVLHVRVTDVESDRVIYAFDLTGGSGLTGPTGSTGAPGLGLADGFDFRNAAQTIYEALAIDYRRYGHRSSRP